MREAELYDVHLDHGDEEQETYISVLLAYTACNPPKQGRIKSTVY